MHFLSCLSSLRLLHCIEIGLLVRWGQAFQEEISIEGWPKCCNFIYDCTGWYTSSTQLECPSRNGNHHICECWLGQLVLHQQMTERQGEVLPYIWTAFVSILSNGVLIAFMLWKSSMQSIWKDFCKAKVEIKCTIEVFSVLGNPGVIMHVCTCI